MFGRRARSWAVLLVTVVGGGLAAPTTPPPDVGYAVPGLAQPVELIVDRWGVPHLYGESTDDVFLAQGFNAARDRLFQIDLWRRRGLGQLAEVLGPDYVAQDRATRMFLYRGDMAAEWETYGPDAQRIATRFAAGINAYVDRLAAHPDELPEEFRLLGYRPARWSPEDVVRIRSHGLTRNLNSEVDRALVGCLAGDPDADQVRVGLQPAQTITVPDGLDPCTIPEDVLDVFDLATQNVTFAEGAIRREPATDPGSEGSNNWTVAPERTATGRPLLANDPHRAYSAPSLRYLTHLSAPGMDVIGAGEPSLPGISIGHNGTIAFGLTIFPIDQEDLYVYELDPADPTRYRHGDGWESMRTLREQVAVAGGPAQEIEMPFTRHGPVIAVDAAQGKAYAVRTAWLEPGMSPYFGSVRYMLARNWDEFTDAMRTWGAPTENQVYADVEGNIGWLPGGLAPRRSGYDGLLPVPGDGRYDWDGFHSGDDLPRSFNPPSGFVATANQYNLPPGSSFEDLGLGYEWTNPFRYQRAAEVLAADDAVSVESSQRLQNDQISIPARRLTALVGGLAPTDGSAERARALLTGWDAVESADSPAAALFEVWLTRHLEPAYKAAMLPAPAAEAFGRPDTRVLLDALERPTGPLSGPRRDALLLDTLGPAFDETTALLGPDPAAWRWGALQHTLFAHPLTGALSDVERARFDVGPLPRGGSKDTVNQSSYRLSDFRQTNGPSFRMVLDVGNWDASTAVNTPGQSGDPDDPHYRDLTEPWRAGEYFPLSYSRDAVERHAERRIVLQPTD